MIPTPGPFELILIFAMVLLFFGAKRLPDFASGLGKGIRDFRRAMNGLDANSMTEAEKPTPVQGAAASPAVEAPKQEAEAKQG